jgi:hypothetical protein
MRSLKSVSVKSRVISERNPDEELLRRRQTHACGFVSNFLYKRARPLTIFS